MKRARAGSDARIVRRYHAHAPGLLYIVVTVFLAVGAINGQNNLLFWAFGAAVGVLLLSGIVSGSAMMGVDIRRTSIDEVAAGEPLAIDYRVDNASRIMPAFGITIAETTRPATSRKRSERSGGRWGHTIARPIAFIAHVRPRGSAVARAVVVPEHCGLLRLEWVTAVSSFPFGLVRKSTTMSRPATAIVLPRRVRLRSELIESLGGAGISGAAVSDRRGESDDFYGLREYQEGESLRRIAWKPSARTGVLLIRQFAAPTPRRLRIVLDVTGAHSDRDLVEWAVTLAGAAARQAHEAGFAIGLRIVGSGVSREPRRESSHLLGVLRDLAMVEPQGLDAEAPADPTRFELNDAVMIVHTGATAVELSDADSVLDATTPNRYLAADGAVSGDEDPEPRPGRSRRNRRKETIG